MSGGTVIAGTVTVGAALSTVGSVIGLGSQIAGIAGGGGGSGGGSVSGGSGGGGIQSNEQDFYKSNASNPFYGVNVSNKPMDGVPMPKNPEMPINKTEPTRTRVATAKETPTQDVGIGQAKQATNDMWADRLSRYLDYNTRSLG